MGGGVEAGVGGEQGVRSWVVGSGVEGGWESLMRTAGDGGGLARGG